MPEDDVQPLHERDLDEHESRAERAEVNPRPAAGQHRIARADRTDDRRPEEHDADERDHRQHDRHADHRGDVAGNHASAESCDLLEHCARFRMEPCVGREQLKKERTIVGRRRRVEPDRFAGGGEIVDGLRVQQLLDDRVGRFSSRHHRQIEAQHAFQLQEPAAILRRKRLRADEDRRADRRRDDGDVIARIGDAAIEQRRVRERDQPHGLADAVRCVPAREGEDPVRLHASQKQRPGFARVQRRLCVRERARRRRRPRVDERCLQCAAADVLAAGENGAAVADDDLHARIAQHRRAGGVAEHAHDRGIDLDPEYALVSELQRREKIASAADADHARRAVRAERVHGADAVVAEKRDVAHVAIPVNRRAGIGVDHDVARRINGRFRVKHRRPRPQRRHPLANDVRDVDVRERIPAIGGRLQNRRSNGAAFCLPNEQQSDR